jgi:hypothetical protein
MNISDSNLNLIPQPSPAERIAPKLAPKTPSTKPTELPDAPVKPKASPNDPVWRLQYEKWKKDNVGKSNEWKDQNIPEYLKVFREHENSVQAELGIKNFAVSQYVATPDPRETTRAQIKAHYKQYGLDIDPDKTYIVTVAYNQRGNKEPYPGTVVNKISLTDAAIKNIQHTPGHSDLPKTSFNPFQSVPPSVKIVDDLTIGHTSHSGRHGYMRNKDAIHTQQYEGIYVDPKPGTNTYDRSNQLSILSPKSFRKYVWDTNFSKPHIEELKKYWNTHRDTYTTLTKMAFATSAHQQYAEGSLSKEERDMALNVANVAPGKSIGALKAGDFQRPYTQDPNLKIKELTFLGKPASGIFYVTNETTKKTLLYMTGNSSPIHPFDSPEAMRKWLSNQMTDENKRKQFAQYFKHGDRENQILEAGVDKKLEMEARFAKDREGLLDRPFGGNDIVDPFKAMQARAEQFTYDNTDFDYVTNDDINKTAVLDTLKAVGKALIILGPLAAAFPPVGYAILAFNLGVAATEVGVGIDDQVRGRPGGSDRIVYGLFNAAAVVTKEVALGAAGGVIKNKFIPSFDPK